MYKSSLLIFSIFLSFVVPGFGQQPTVTILKGMIVNASTGEAIPYATIQLSKNGVNTMSNEKGRFVFKIPACSAGDSVYISHVGYQPMAFVVRPSDTMVRNLKLVPAGQLPEVVIKPPNPLELIHQAIAKISDNYPATPYRMGGFYRLTGEKEKKIIDLSEAVFDIYSEDFKGKNRQFRLAKARVDKDLTAFNGGDGIRIGWKPAEILNFDRVSHIDRSDFLGEQGMKDHHFVYKGLINYNGRDAYVITFYEREGVKKALNDGRMIIDADNLAFLEFDLWANPAGLKYYDWGFLQRLSFKLMHFRCDPLSDTSIITYRKYGEKYYLDHVNNTTRFYLASDNRRVYFNPLLNKTNYLVTSIDTSGVQPFPKEEVMGDKKRIEGRSEVLNDTPDSPDRSDTTDHFWADYNLIQAEFNVDSAIRVIQMNNATLNYKRVLEAALPKYGKDKVARIDSILSFYSRKEQFSGTALVQYEGKVIYEKGFGWADREHKIVNGLMTQFRIGSTSKQFTSMLIMQLVKEASLSVDDTVGKFLRGYVHGGVTIRQLLTHTSGIPNYLENYLGEIIRKSYSVDEIVRKFCSDSLEFAPGSRFNYSNSGYVVLAAILEKATGKKYAELLTERIFAPLGMKNSFFVSAGPAGGNLAVGYIEGQRETPYPVENEAGAGGITSSAPDLLLWANAVSSYALLPREQTDEWLKPRIPWDDWSAYYGYGWMIDRALFRVSGKHTIQYHPGTELGFFDMLVRQPDKGIVLLLLNNTGDFPRFDMTDLILNELN